MFTKENAARYIPLLQALSEGKTIQIKIVGEKSNIVGWSDIVGPVRFYGPVEDYRVKPEPRVIWVQGTMVCEDWEMDRANYSEAQLSEMGWYKYVQVIDK